LVKVRTISSDLSGFDGIAVVIEKTEKLFIELLINNAGKEASGPFLGINIADMVSSISLNCTVPLMLSHHCTSSLLFRLLCI